MVTKTPGLRAGMAMTAGDFPVRMAYMFSLSILFIAALSS
jgi:hypothetical protein